MMEQKGGLRLFISACIPGCGQMYQGYMKRGVSLLLGTFTLFVITMLLRMEELVFFVPVIWLYAFFDSYNLRSLLARNAAPEDAYLLGLSGLDGERLTALFRKRHSLIGWCLVAAGAWALYSTLLSSLPWWFIPDDLHELLYYGTPRVVVTLAVIALGLWFIRGPKAPPKEDFQPFTPAPDAASGSGSLPAAEAPAQEQPAEQEAANGDD